MFQGGQKIDGPPKMFIGAAANPFADPFELRVARLAKKVKAGVDFIQTQCIYNVDKFEKWMEGIVDRGLHEKVYILAGITPMISAEFLEQIFFRLRKAEVIRSVRGPGGGFFFARPLDQITLLDIIEASGEGMGISPCACGKKVVCDRRAFARPSMSGSRGRPHARFRRRPHRRRHAEIAECQSDRSPTRRPRSPRAPCAGPRSRVPSSRRARRARARGRRP